MYNQSLIKQVATKLNLPDANASRLLDVIVANLVHELSCGNDVDVDGFGRFEVKTLPGRKTVFFKQAIEFKN